ncbi:MAG: GntR family transcriptional regulator [Firmicutes bacterium]|nr:GntR family transcriptional regulator [Bacillota bacterium]
MEQTAIRPQKGLPLYLQLKQMIQAQIASGVMHPGDRVPSERELSDRFGMSRMTARQALLELVREGFLYREQGRGTFVAHRKVNQGLLGVTSFTDDMRLRGVVPESVALDQVLELADAEAREQLQLDIGAMVVRLKRLRLGDGRPMALEEAILPAHFVEGLEDHPLDKDFSLYAYLRERGILFQRAHQTLEAVLAEEDQSRFLGVLAGAPLLLLERLSFRQDGQPMEFVRAYYRADRFKFFVDLNQG